jgi:crossover junction endodeoxyribonuclease RuvC
MPNPIQGFKEEGSHARTDNFRNRPRLPLHRLRHHRKGQNTKYITSGIVKADQENFPQRLRTIFIGLQSIMQEYQPTELAIEQVFMHENANSAIKLGQARGVAIAATFAHDLEVYEYSAKQIKQAVVGYGNAAKEQIQAMVQRLLNLSAPPQADAADALACAICHFHSRKHS